MDSQIQRRYFSAIMLAPSVSSTLRLTNSPSSCSNSGGYLCPKRLTDGRIHVSVVGQTNVGVLNILFNSNNPTITFRKMNSGIPSTTPFVFRLAFVSNSTALSPWDRIPFCHLLRALTSKYGYINRHCDLTWSSFPYYVQDPVFFKQYMLDYYYFTVAGVPQILGYVHKSIIDKLSWPEYWLIDVKYRTLHLLSPPDTLDPYDRRTALVNETILEAKKEGKIKEMTRISEQVAVCTLDGKPVFEMNSQGTEIFGNVSFSVQLIAWTMRPEGKLYWLQRRAMTKAVCPGHLGTIAGGGLHVGEKKSDAMAREAQEEASIPLDLSRSRMKACGTVSYHRARSFLGNAGSYPIVSYVYEMELPETFVPEPNDGEVDEFITMTESHIIGVLYEGGFRPMLTALLVDHFYRHGSIDADNEPHLQEICSRLHRMLDMPRSQQD